MGFGGASTKPSTFEIFTTLARIQKEETDKAKRDEEDRERIRIAGRGRVANIFAGDTEESLGINKKFLGSVGVA